MNHLEKIESHLINSSKEIENCLHKIDEIKGTIMDNPDKILWEHIMNKKLSNCPEYMVEFYKESPNWSLDNLHNIINWEYKDNGLKKILLNKEINDYTYDGEIN